MIDIGFKRIGSNRMIEGGGITRTLYHKTIL